MENRFLLNVCERRTRRSLQAGKTRSVVAFLDKVLQEMEISMFLQVLSTIPEFSCEILLHGAAMLNFVKSYNMGL